MLDRVGSSGFKKRIDQMVSATEDTSSLMKLLSRDFIDGNGNTIKITNIEAQYLIQSSYDDDYRLKTGSRGVSMPKEEMVVANSLYKYWLREYQSCNIHSTWGLNFYDFLELSRAEISMLCELSIEPDAVAVAELNKFKALLGK